MGERKKKEIERGKKCGWGRKNTSIMSLQERSDQHGSWLDGWVWIWVVFSIYGRSRSNCQCTTGQRWMGGIESEGRILTGQQQCKGGKVSHIQPTLSTI